MVAYLMPQYIVMALPFTVFVGTLNTYNSLSQSRELTILHSIGRSPVQIIRPSIYAGGVCVLISFIGYGYFMPQGWYQFQSKKHDITNKTLLSKQVIAGKFQNIGNGSTMFVEAAQANRIQNVFIYNAVEKVILTASEGEIIDGQNTTTIVLKNGTQQSSLEANSQPPIISFENYTISFNTPFQYYQGKQKVDEMTNTELLVNGRIKPAYYTEFWRRLVDSLLPLLLSIIGTITVIIKPISRIPQHRYTIVGSASMVFSIAFAMTLSTKVAESVWYLYYNALFVVGFCIVLWVYITLKSSTYKIRIPL